jgi:hypothetical protein
MAEKYLFHVAKLENKGVLVPSEDAREAMRAKGYRIGDTIAAVLSKPRNPLYHRFGHVFGKMVVENIEGFEELNPHQALKRLQIESGVGCDEMKVKVEGLGFVDVRVPQSLSFGSMDEGTFKEVMAGLSQYVIKTYWPTLTVDEINRMMEAMP